MRSKGSFYVQMNEATEDTITDGGSKWEFQAE